MSNNRIHDCEYVTSSSFDISVVYPTHDRGMTKGHTIM